MNPILSGTKVRLKGTNYTGEVTISKAIESKVIFDDGDGPDYWYYPNADLEITMYKADAKIIAQLENNFTYHPPVGGQQERYVMLRDNAKKLAYEIVTFTPPSREQALALTNLEQAIFWANAAIARNE